MTKLHDTGDLAATLNALRLGSAFEEASDDDAPPEATQVLDAKQQQELMVLRANQSKKLQSLDKHIVVMFTDLVGSTQYYERYGDLKGREKVLTHNSLLFPIVQQNAGVIVKTIGDAIMCYFESVDKSLKAAARMQQSLAAYNQSITSEDDQIHIRIALNAGVAIAQAGDIYGDVVNVAARIEHQAKADEILMSGSVADEGKRAFPIEAAGSATFKGKAEPVALFRLRWLEVTEQKQKAVALPERFEVRELLSRGSHGELYLVEDRRTRRNVVIKRLYDYLAEDPEARAAFVVAAREQARLELDGVIRVFGHSQQDEVPTYYEAEIVDGASLSRFVSRKGPSKPDEAVAIVLRVCAILQTAHQAGTLHRNLEPDNVVVRSGGKLALTNFAMGDITASRVRRGFSPPGSLAFMAPEQLLGKTVTVQSDVYSAGALLYFLLSGREPIEDASSMQGTMIAAQGGIVPLKLVCKDVSPAMAAVVTRAMSLAPKARQADIKAFAQDLQKASGAQSFSVPAYLKDAPAKLAPQAAPVSVPPPPPAPVAKPKQAAAVVPEVAVQIGEVPLDIGEETVRAPLLPPPKPGLVGGRLVALCIVLLSVGIATGLLLAPRGVAPNPVEPVKPVVSPVKPAPNPLASKLEAAGVVRHGDAFVLIEAGKAAIEWFRDDVSQPADLGRMTLAVSAFAIGKLFDDGKIRSLSEPLATWFPEWQQGKKRQVTLRNLLEHTTGMTLPSPDDPLKPANIWRFALAADVVDVPGSKRAFNPKAFNLLTGLVQISAGKKLDAYFESAIVKPLGLRTPVWSYDAEQNPIPTSGLSWHAQDLAALGLAFIDGGQAKGLDGGQAKTEAKPTGVLFGQAWRDAASTPIIADSTVSLIWQLRAHDKPDNAVFYVGDGRGSFWLIAPAKRIVAVRLSRSQLTDPHASLTALLPLLGLGGDPLKEPASQPASAPVVKAMTRPSSQPAAPQTVAP